MSFAVNHLSVPFVATFRFNFEFWSFFGDLWENLGGNWSLVRWLNSSTTHINLGGGFRIATFTTFGKVMKLCRNQHRFIVFWVPGIGLLRCRDASSWTNAHAGLRAWNDFIAIRRIFRLGERFAILLSGIIQPSAIEEKKLRNLQNAKCDLHLIRLLVKVESFSNGNYDEVDKLRK